MGFFFSALMLFAFWLSYQPCDIRPLLKIFGSALIVDGLWVKMSVMHVRGKGTFKIEHSLIAAVVDTLLGVLLFALAFRGGKTTKEA